MPIVPIPDPRAEDGVVFGCSTHGVGPWINEEVHPREALASDQTWTRWCDRCQEEAFYRAHPEELPLRYWHGLPQAEAPRDVLVERYGESALLELEGYAREDYRQGGDGSARIGTLYCSVS